MLASWGSRLLKIVPAACAALLLVAAAEAKVIVRDSGETVNRVRITSGGMTVDRSVPGGGATVVVADSVGGGALIVDGGSGMVRLFSDARIGAGERLDGDVVAVFGSVHIAGHVTGDVVAVFGSVGFEPGATVGGDAVAVGGSVEDVEGVRIAGETVSVGLVPLSFGLPGVPVMLACLALGWIVTLFFGWVFAALFPERLARAATTASRRTLLSLLLGLLAFLVMPVFSILLIVTVIGLPVGIMLPFAYVALLYAGQIAGTYVLGSKLVRRPLGEGGALPAIVAGSLLVGSFFAVGVILWGSPGTVRTFAVFFHLVGLLVVTGLSLIGSGALLLSRLGSRPPHLAETAAPGPSPGAAAPGAATLAG